MLGVEVAEKEATPSEEGRLQTKKIVSMLHASRLDTDLAVPE